MSVEAAKLAAAKAAAAIQAQLGMNLGVSIPGVSGGDVVGGEGAGGSGGDGGNGNDDGPLIDLSATYPGVPPGWGAGMNEPQLRAAYQQHTRQSRRLYVGSIPNGTQNFDLQQFFNDAMLTSGRLHLESIRILILAYILVRTLHVSTPCIRRRRFKKKATRLACFCFKALHHQ